MAQVYGKQRTIQLSGDKAFVSDVTGKVRVFQDEYEAAALSAGSTIELAILPKGARVVGGNLLFDALGASSTLAVGTSSNATLYLPSGSSASAGNRLFGSIDSLSVPLADETVVLVTTGGAPITGTVKLIVEYVLD